MATKMRVQQGVSVRALSEEVGIGPSELVRIARLLGKRDSFLLPIGSRTYVKPGRRARINDRIAAMIRSGVRRPASEKPR